jgi:LuxR family transcriptional regulator, activator of conjugal transfer of Ti plasmids
MESNEAARYLDEHVNWLVDALELVREPAAIRQALHHFAKCSGFDRFAYGHIQGTDTRVFSNYPEEWLRRYLDEGYFAIDPTIANAKRSPRPFAWSAADMMRHGGEIRKIAGEASEFGIKSGFTIPIRTGFGRVALLSLASESTNADCVAIRDETHAATAIAYVHINLARNRDDPLQTVDVSLSPREVTCLNWASIGKTQAEIASLTSLSEKTVRFYLEQARVKLGASNTTHAVMIAAERRLI